MSVRINRNEILGHFDIGAVTESYGTRKIIALYIKYHKSVNYK